MKFIYLPNIIVILSPVAYLKKFLRKIAKSSSNLIWEAQVRIYYITKGNNNNLIFY